MTRTFDSRKVFPAYMGKPDYYRLGYQLVALRATQAASWRWEQAEGQVRRSSDPPGEWHPRAAFHVGEKERRSVIAEGLSDGRKLAGKVSNVLDWFARREQSPGWGRALDEQEQRLGRFLAGTVEPCLTLVIESLRLEVACMVHSQSPDTEFSVPLTILDHRPRVSIRWSGPLGMAKVTTETWSYRAFYNLACLDALRRNSGLRELPIERQLCDLTGLDRGMRSREPVNIGLWALGQALVRVQGHSLSRLLHMARTDPTLQLMEQDAGVENRFRELLAQYSLPESLPQEPAPEIDDRFPLTAGELRAFERAHAAFDWDEERAASVLRRAVTLKRDALSRTAAGLPTTLTLTGQAAWRALYEFMELDRGT